MADEYKCNICGRDDFKNKSSLGNHIRWHNPSKKLKESVQGSNNNNYNKHTIAGENNPMYGKRQTREAREKMSLTRTGESIFVKFRTSINKRLRESKEYKEWRLMVFGRDNFTCQDCGKRGCYIEAHHIKSFAEYKDLRFDIDNGITYCLKCHCKHDKHRNKLGGKQ